MSIIKNLPVLTFLFTLMVMAGPAEAQNGYRGYIGPNSDVYAKDFGADIGRNVPPGVLSLGYYFIHSTKGQSMLRDAREYVAETPYAQYMLSEADDYVNSPMAKQHLSRVKRYVNNPKAYRTVERAQRFMAAPSAGRDELLSEVSYGKNFNFLAGNAIGYLRTGQVDVIGNKMLVYQGGSLYPQSYDVRTKRSGHMIIDGPEGRKIGWVDQTAENGSLRLMTHGLAIPVRINTFMPHVDDQH